MVTRRSTLFAASFCLRHIEIICGNSIHRALREAKAHFSKTATIIRIFLLLWWRILTEPVFEVGQRGRMQIRILEDLAYAAFHCSSRLAFALSRSFWETKREPTTPVDNDGMMDSSIVV